MPETVNFQFYRGEPVTLQGAFATPPEGGLAGKTLLFVMKNGYGANADTLIETEVDIVETDPDPDEVCWQLTLAADNRNDDADLANTDVPADVYPFEVSYVDDDDPEEDGKLITIGLCTVDDRPRSF